MAITQALPSPKYSDYTQAILNQFPEYHAARAQRDSAVARVSDATYGRSLTSLNNVDIHRLSTQRSITSADNLSADKAFLMDVSSVNIEKSRSTNLVRNSNYQYWSNPNRLPDYWSIDAEDNIELMDKFKLILHKYKFDLLL